MKFSRIFEPHVVATPRVQTTSLMPSGMPVSGRHSAGGDGPVRSGGLLERRRFQNGEEGVHLRFHRANPPQHGAGQLHRGDVPVLEKPVGLGDGQLVELHARGSL